jgi:hypothetical protein
MEDGQVNEPARWERAGFAIGLIIALAIMWGVLGFALIAEDGGSGSSRVIYDQPDSGQQKALDDDDTGPASR